MSERSGFRPSERAEPYEVLFGQWSVAVAVGILLGGAVLTETVFAWPGLGRYLTISMFAADVPAILGGTLLIGACFIVLNTLTDLLVSGLDPRLRR